MWLTRVAARRSGRIALIAGLGLASAVALTLTVFALRDDDAATAALDDARVVAFETIAARSDTPAESVVLEAALPEPTQPADEPAPDAPPAPQPEAPPVATPTPEPLEPAFASLPVMDPLSNDIVKPVAFADLPVADTPEVEDDESGIPLYVPGSIGAAKRGWAGTNGTSPARESRGRIAIVQGGGHCPVPGRVPPYWKNRVL
jgi:hypothetical protein